MKRSLALYGFIFLVLTAVYACNNAQQTKEHIQANRQLLAKKQSALGDLNYKVTHNSLNIGTSRYDSTIGKDFTMASFALQASIDSLKAQTDSLEQLLPK